MRILYVSVHSVLEYDEIRLFRRLGHEVFSLGATYGLGMAEPLRDVVPASAAERELHERFVAMGGQFRYTGAPADQTVLPPGFVELFDVVVVMHDMAFLEKFWELLSVRPVIWRTIGQGIEWLEPRAAPMWEAGLSIVRYSPVERAAPDYCGETALIRFGKEEPEFGSWNGAEASLLTFTNTFAQRFPGEIAIYRDIVQDLPSRLGGIGNVGEPNYVGFLEHQAQKAMLRDCRAYLYCSGASIPYTLNFMEAMMTGIPILAFDFGHPFYEVASLLADGAGIVAAEAGEARAAARRLLEDPGYAAEVGARGRARAVELFGYDAIGPQWQSLFERLA